MIAAALAVAALALAALPAVLVVVNLAAFRPPRAAARGSETAVAVLIPARNEERSIARAVESALANAGVPVQVHVMDDGSEDATAAVVRRIAARDPRVHLHRSPPLPAGWCGKQHACFALSRECAEPVMVFMDADVELGADALARIVGFLDDSGADLVSGFPHQRTGSFLERLLIPLIHFVLLGFLPLVAMRRSRQPGFGAGCGQLMAARREAYERVGGHRAIRASRHDGIQLPRAFRRAGLRTDLFDASAVASCRMYRGAREVWNGLAKNATEGMASPPAIVPWSLLLLGGQVLPPVLLAAGRATGASGPVLGLALAAAFLGFAARALLAGRIRQSWLGVLLHPLGVLLLVAVQWYALLRETVGRPVAWKGRLA